MRVTSHINEQTGKFEVYVIDDHGEAPQKTVKVESEHDTSSDANKRVQELQAMSDEDLKKAFGGGKKMNPGSRVNE